MPLTEYILDIRRVFGWLSERVEQAGRSSTAVVKGVSPSAQVLLGQLTDAVKSMNRAKTWRLIQRLNEMTKMDLIDPGAKPYQDYILGYIYLCCALAYYDMGHLKDCLNALREAIGRYYNGSRFELAIALWMKGYVLWQLPDHHEEASFVWQRSLGFLRDLRSVLMAGAERDLYQRCIDQMEVSLKRCIELDGLPEQKTAALQTWYALNAIPAGCKDAKDLLKDKPAQIESTQFWINKQLCVLELLEKADKTLFAWDYLVLRVSGNSMDKAYIFDGDFVLMKVPPEPKSNDLVAVVINTTDKNAVIRRYVEAQEGITFKVASSEAIWKDITCKGSAEYQIHGVIVGVFRPVRCTM